MTGTSPRIRTIVLQGDSHTWGEGVGGEFTLGSPSCAADTRKLGFAFPCYANIIRRRVCEATGSEAHDIDWREISLLYNRDISGKTIRRGCTPIERGRPFAVTAEAGFVLFDFRHSASQTKAVVKIDGFKAADIDLTGEERDSFDDDYVRLPVWTENGKHEISVEAACGSPLLRRIEFHSGKYAVINSGFGSRSIKEYMAGYWQDEVVKYKPYIIALECNTVNDWLRGKPPESYAEYVGDLIAAAHELTDRVIIHNVFPIMGIEADPYSEYDFTTINKRVRAAAIGSGHEDEFADISALAKERMSGLSDWEKAMRFYHDNWHPNESGYEVYADAIWEKLKDML